MSIGEEKPTVMETRWNWGKNLKGQPIKNMTKFLNTVYSFLCYLFLTYEINLLYLLHNLLVDFYKKWYFDLCLFTENTSRYIQYINTHQSTNGYPEGHDTLKTNATIHLKQVLLRIFWCRQVRNFPHKENIKSEGCWLCRWVQTGRGTEEENTAQNDNI